jgi:DNA polymerase-1
MDCKYKEECKFFTDRKLDTSKKYLFLFSSPYAPFMPTLRKMALDVGLDLEDVDFQTVKCSYKAWELDLYLPVNQIKKCATYFDGIKGYKAIVAFGNPASKVFNRKGNIYNYMFYPNYYNNIPVYTTFPIYEIRYNPLKIQWAEKTLKRLSSIPNKPVYNIVEVTDNDRLDRCINEIKKSKMIVFDVETNGLLPKFYSGNGIITSVGVSANENTVYMFSDSYVYTLFPKLKQYFENPEYNIIAHNIQFDTQVLYLGLGIDIKGRLIDTMLLAYLFNEKQEISLKALAPQIGIYYSEEEETQFKTGKDLSKEDFIRYNAKDVMATLLLYNRYMKLMVDNDHIYKAFNHILSPLQKVLIKIQENGMPIDVVKLKELTKKYEKDLDELRSKMHALPEVIAYEKDNGELNINSTQQLVVLLTKYYNIELTKTTDKGSLKIDKAVLESLRDSNAKDFIEPLMEYKVKSKLLSTYLASFIKKNYIGKDKRLHSNFMISTGTGRLSSNSPNLQNIAGNKDIKALLVPMKSNHIMLNADYSSCELRVSAGISNEKSMIEAFKNGADLHARVGHEVFGEPEHVYKEDKKKRTMVKAINFGLLYGMGAYTLAKRIGVSEKEAQDYINSYYKTYANITRKIEEYQTFARNNGYVYLPFGKRRFILDIANRFNSNVSKTDALGQALKRIITKQKSSAEREAYNTIVQGTSVFFTYLSLIRIQEYIDENNLDACIINTVHDSIVFSIDKDTAFDFIPVLMELMTDYEYEWLNGVPLRADVEIGYDYGHLHEVEKDILEDKNKFDEFIASIKEE